jgi:hypothetical protein
VVLFSRYSTGGAIGSGGKKTHGTKKRKEKAKRMFPDGMSV